MGPLLNNDNKEVLGGDRIQFASDFYASLYTLPQSSPLQQASLREFINLIPSTASSTSPSPPSVPTFQDTEKAFLKSANAMKNEKSPGMDGLPAELYKACPALVEALARVWRQDRNNWKSGTGIISLLYKKGDRRELNNWRPISLLNVDHKIIATALNRKLSKLAMTSIGPYQHGFIRNRKILEPILRIKAMRHLLLLKNLEGGILSIDFKKAFDTVFRETSLLKLNAPKELIDMIKLLAENGTACININGFFSSPLPLMRGVRQGCPLSPSLFAFATVSLEKMVIKKCLFIETHFGKLHIDMFADDLTAYISNSSQILTWADLLKAWELASGLGPNFDKSSLFSRSFQHSSPFRKTSRERVLGDWIYDSEDDRKWVIQNFAKYLADKYRSWNLRLPTSSKAVVWNSVMGGVFNYFGHIIEFTSGDIKRLDNSMKLFFAPTNKWNDKKFTLLPRDAGGAGAILPSLWINNKMRDLANYIAEGRTQTSALWQSILKIHKSVSKSKWIGRLRTNFKEASSFGLEHNSLKSLGVPPSPFTRKYRIHTYISGVLSEEFKAPIRPISSPRHDFWISLHNHHLPPNIKDFARKLSLNLLPEILGFRKCPKCGNSSLTSSSRHFTSCPSTLSFPNASILLENLHSLELWDISLDSTLLQLWIYWKQYIKLKHELLSLPQ